MYNPHLVYDIGDLDLSKNWTVDFWLKIKPGRPVNSESHSEIFMSLSTNLYFRLDTQSSPRLHCTWLGTMGSEAEGISGPLSSGSWYHMALVHKENGEWTFYVNGMQRSTGVTSSDTSGGSPG